jgi:hypothetical protein
MLQSITNQNYIHCLPTYRQTLRAIFALAFLMMIGAMLLMFPGPLFHKVAKIPHYSSELSTPTPPNDAEAQTVELRKTAVDALASLKAKSVIAGSAR